MKLAEALLVIKQKEAEVYALNRKRGSSKFQSYRKTDQGRGPVVTTPDVDVDETTNTINKLNSDIRKMRRLVSKANVETKIDWVVDEEQITLAEAIILIQQMRQDLYNFTDLSSAKTYSRVNDMGARALRDNSSDKFSFEEVFEVTYDTKKYSELADTLTRKVNKLEAVIQQTNWTVDIDWEE
jgi:sulfur transfer complex TusBCD TusB component (DsrH family)